MLGERDNHYTMESPLICGAVLPGMILMKVWVRLVSRRCRWTAFCIGCSCRVCLKMEVQLAQTGRPNVTCFEPSKSSTRMGFEPTRAEPNGLAVHRLNHSATSSWANASFSLSLLLKARFGPFQMCTNPILKTGFKGVHRWFSGRMLACHAGGPGSIPGRCKMF